MIKFYLVPLFVLFISCAKEEVQAPDPPVVNLPPGSFEVNLDNITDRTVSVSWGTPADPEHDPITYEVAVNDSVVAFDLTVNLFTISQLMPDNSYKISVIAIDENLNTQAVSKTLRTAKSYVKSVFSFHQGVDKYGFTSAISTSDGGFLIYGYTARTGEDRSIAILKLESDYSIGWVKEFAPSGDNGYPNQMIECSDNNYLIVREKTVLKIDTEGNTLWSFQSADNGQMSFRSILESTDGKLFLAGNYYNEPGEHKGQYFLIGLTSDGMELFRNISNTGSVYGIGQIMSDESKLILFGATNYMLCIMKLDYDGNLISTFTVPNTYSASNMPLSLSKTGNNDYMMFSTIAGWEYGTEYLPRLVKTTRDGFLLWDKYYPLYSTPSQYAPIMDCVTHLSDGNYLCLISDDNGLSAAYLDDEGNVLRHVKLPGFPSSICVTENQIGEHIFLTSTGEIVVCDPEGYNS